MPEPTFSNGTKTNPDGSTFDMVKVKNPLSSNGTTVYTTILWGDGEYSCDCPGWTILKKDKFKRPKPRTCKHCKEAIKKGAADMMDVATARANAQSQGTQIAMPAVGVKKARRGRSIRMRDE
jgi:hypothetical protein